MNFIIRNLGWILLIIFFIFMLYLISNQNNTKKIEEMKSTMIESGSLDSPSEGVKNLIVESNDPAVSKPSNLVANLEEQDDKVVADIKEELGLEKEMTGSGAGALLGEPKLDSGTGGFVQSIRDFFTIKKIGNIDETMTGISLSGGVDDVLIKKVENELSNPIEIISEETSEPIENIEENGDKKMGFFDKIKKSMTAEKTQETLAEEKSEDGEEISAANNNDITTEVKEIEAKQPTKTVESGKSKMYEVGVDSMFLNNAWFTKRTGVVFMGDKLEQLTPTNRYGCFKIKVVNSKNQKNNGTIAWACEYYMKGYEESMYKYEAAAYEYNNSLKKKHIQPTVKKQHAVKQMHKSTAHTQKVVVKKTAVGTLYSVDTHSLKLNDKHFNSTLGYLIRGDRVEQISHVNSRGCFEASVYNSKAHMNNNGKTGWVCQKYLK